MHIVRPTILFSITPTVRFTVNDKTAYQELFHSSGIYIVHSVKLHVALKYRTHRFTKFLFIPITCGTSRFFTLASIHAKHASHKPTDKVVFQRHVALTFNVFFLAHGFSVHTNHIVPLETIGIAFVSLPVFPKVVHLAPIVLCFHKNVKCPAVTITFCRNNSIYLGGIISSRSYTAHWQQFSFAFIYMHIFIILMIARNKYTAPGNHPMFNYLRVLFISSIISFLSSFNSASISLRSSSLIASFNSL